MAKYKEDNSTSEQLFKNIWPTVLILLLTLIAIFGWLFINNDPHFIGTLLTCLSLFSLHIVLVSNARRRLSFYVGSTKIQRNDIITIMDEFDRDSEGKIRSKFVEMSQHIEEINDKTNFIASTRFIWMAYIVLAFLIYKVEWFKSFTGERYSILFLTLLCYFLVEVNFAYFRWKFSKVWEKIHKKADEIRRRLDEIDTLDPEMYLEKKESEPSDISEAIDPQELKVTQELRDCQINEKLIKAVLESCQKSFTSKAKIETIRKRLKMITERFRASIHNIEVRNLEFFEEVSKTYQDVPKWVKSLILSKGPTVVSKLA